MSLKRFFKGKKGRVERGVTGCQNFIDQKSLISSPSPPSSIFHDSPTFSKQEATAYSVHQVTNSFFYVRAGLVPHSCSMIIEPIDAFIFVTGAPYFEYVFLNLFFVQMKIPKLVSVISFFTYEFLLISWDY